MAQSTAAPFATAYAHKDTCISICISTYSESARLRAPLLGGMTKRNIRARRQTLAPQKLPSQKFSSHLSFELVKARNINAGGSNGSFKLPRPAVGPVHVLLTSFGRENLTITWDSRPFSLSSGNFFGIQQAFLKALFAQILLSLRSWCTINFMLFWYVYIPVAFISNQKAASTPSN